MPRGVPDWQHYPADGLAAVVEGLRALEAAIEYPLDDDHFTIDHGADYAAFYRGLGEAHYLVASDGDAVVGVIAGALRDAWVGEKRVPAVYLGDLKVAPTARGTGLARKLAVGCVRMMKQSQFRRWRLVYFAAMRGDRGDVTRSLRGLNPGRFLRPLGRLRLYFVEPSALRSLSGGPGVPIGCGLDLSGPSSVKTRSTRGRKDLRLKSTGEPWPLVHLLRGPSSWSGGLGQALAAGAAEMSEGDVACFGIDERLSTHVDWLAKHQIEPGAVCTVHGFAWPGVLRDVAWLHLATAEI